MAAMKKAAPEARARKAPRKKKTTSPTSSAPGEGAKAHEWLMTEVLPKVSPQEERVTERSAQAHQTQPHPAPEEPDAAPEKQKPFHLWKPGQSGNPQGRPKGSRNKLGEAFIADLYADWLENGMETVMRVREEKPDQYLKVVASILPKQVDVKLSEFAELTDDALDKQIRQLQEQLGRALAIVDPKERMQ